MYRAVMAVGLVLWIAAAADRGMSADPPEPALPPAATGILSQMDKDIVATKSKTIIALDKVLKDTTKKGDLAGAMAVKAAIDQLKVEVQTTQGARAAGGRVDAGVVAGRWTDGTCNMDLLADGSCTCNDMKAKWRIDGNTVEIKWTHGFIYRLKISPEGLVGVRLNPAGNQDADLRFTRAK